MTTQEKKVPVPQNYRELSEVPAFVYYQPKDNAETPPELKWSGSKPPPAIGARIKVTMNGICFCEVIGYFEDYSWLGLLVIALDPPTWYVKQNGRGSKGRVFGVEFDEENVS